MLCPGVRSAPRYERQSSTEVNMVCLTSAAETIRPVRDGENSGGEGGVEVP